MKKDENSATRGLSTQSETLNKMGSKAMETLDESVHMVKAESEKILESRKAAAIHYLEDYANAVEDAAQSLEKHHHGEATPLLHSASKKLNDMAQFLQSKTVTSMADDTLRLARENPYIFAAGAFMAGMIAARFAKASTSQKVSSSQYGSNYGRSENQSSTQASKTAQSSQSTQSSQTTVNSRAGTNQNPNLQSQTQKTQDKSVSSATGNTYEEQQNRNQSFSSNTYPS